MTNSAIESFAKHAPEYEAQRRRLVPSFDELYGTAIAAIGRADGGPRRILELGAGTGLLSAMVADAYPGAELQLVDGAEPMLDQAAATLGDRAEYRVADLREPLPEGPFCAIVSALAIHHLDDADKRALFSSAHAALRPGGVFVNAEQILAPAPRLEREDHAWHRATAMSLGATADEWRGAEERMSHDRCATLEDQLAWFRAAGFEDVDCLFKQRRMAVIFARRRPASTDARSSSSTGRHSTSGVEQA